MSWVRIPIPIPIKEQLLGDEGEEVEEHILDIVKAIPMAAEETLEQTNT